MASTRKKNSAKWPFVFYNHGLWDYKAETQSAHWYVVFEHEVPEGERAALAQGAPPPSRGPFFWGGGRILLLESPTERYFDSYVWRTYGPNAKENLLEEDEHELTDEELATYDEDSEVTKREAQAFRDALDAWLNGVHQRHPVSLVAASHGSLKDPWSKWSIEETPVRVLPLLRQLQTTARPALDETKQPHSAEVLLAWVVHEVVGQYFELHDPKQLEPPLQETMIAILRGSLGHEGQADESLEWLLRCLRKPAAPV